MTTLSEPLDGLRRWMGAGFDLAGLGPEVTPSQTVMAAPGITLRRYSAATAPGPTLLIVPAPIKRAYIWDLLPSVSVVRRALAGGLSVYLIEWERPCGRAQSFGLAEYAGRMILDGLDAIAREQGTGPVFLAGHSLGGTLAALFAALHPERLKGLILLSTPLHFGAGTLDRLVALMPPALPGLVAATGPIGGSLLSLGALLADPWSFGWERWLGGLHSLRDRRTLRTFLAVERWTYDEMPMAPRLFREVVEELYQSDRFMQGTLSIDSRPVTPRHIRAPVLSVIDPYCLVVPPPAVLPFHRALAHPETVILRYAGDSGVALRHVSMLVGEHAHRSLWPKILRWIHAHGD
ncbi:alpha/beta fold hydrolase [Candidatus Methylocalor cossyra]|uniref:Polyhydroxyalkanoate synthase n=1 Tax=Candidatus Methylocalor cossyra TaxID=3108543 RepID=A0ABM9NEP4_9GAMM